MEPHIKKQQKVLVFVTIAYGMIALLYDLKMAVIYCGILVVGGTALDIMNRKLKQQRVEIEKLKTEIKNLKNSTGS